MSRQKEVLSWGLIILVLLLIAGAALYALWPQLQPHTSLHLGDGVFTARVAKTDAELRAGLSGTHSLRKDQAMIFVYGSDKKWPVSMKGMNYTIDAVWLDANKKVVYIVKNVPPESYPYETFTPKEDARYVVELPEGTVTTKAITIGSTATFDENNLEGLKL